MGTRAYGLFIATICTTSVWRGLMNAGIEQIEPTEELQVSTSHVCESFYIKVIQPSIAYVMPVWGGVNQTQLFETLERQHSRAVRIIFGCSPDMPTVDVLAAVKLSTLVHQYKCSLI